MTAFREAAQATMPVRVAENLKLRAEAQLAAAETALGSAISAEAKEQAEGAKAQAAARIAELQAQWTAAKAELQPKLDAVTAAREAAVAAETARVAAAEAARQVARELEPVSVLISRKTQRLYVRQAFEPVLESPVTIRCRSSDRHACLHRHGAGNGDDEHAMERRLFGAADVRTAARSSRMAGRAGPGSRRRADADGPGRCKDRARPDCHSAGRIGSHRRDGAAVFPDHHRRGVELGDRQGHGFRGPLERRAARRHQDPAAKSRIRVQLHTIRQPAHLAPTFRWPVRLVRNDGRWRLLRRGRRGACAWRPVAMQEG